ncbi:MAG: hypothetical protein ACE5DS_02765 [Kiloniellaceae bacterium]
MIERAFPAAPVGKHGVALALVAGLLVPGSLMADPGTTHERTGAGRGIKDVVYDYAVTSYCGVLTRVVQVGYERELARMTGRAGLTRAQAKAERIAGWVAADLEWGNRGLGGYRAWCRTEGLGAARHFEEIAGEAP